MDTVLLATYCPEPWWPWFSKEATQAGRVEMLVGVLTDRNGR